MTWCEALKILDDNHDAAKAIRDDLRYTLGDGYLVVDAERFLVARLIALQEELDDVHCEVREAADRAVADGWDP